MSKEPVYNRIRYEIGRGKKRYLFVRVEVDDGLFVEGVVVSVNKRESKERVFIPKDKIVSRFRYVPGFQGRLVKFGYKPVRKAREKRAVVEQQRQEAA